MAGRTHKFCTAECDPAANRVAGALADQFLLKLKSVLEVWSEQVL